MLGEGGSTGLAEQFRELLQGLADTARIEPTVDELAANWLRSLTPLSGSYFGAGEQKEIGLDTVLR